MRESQMQITKMLDIEGSREDHYRRKVILIADDDEDDCHFIEAAFGDCGIDGEFHFAHNGVELVAALRSLAKQNGPDTGSLPDLVTLDLNMPLLDGREALKEIKGEPALSSIPILILTTSNEKADIEYCKGLGAIAFMTKPSEYKDWVSGLEAIIKRLFDPDMHQAACN